MALVAMAAPELVVDFTTRQPKADPDGQPLYTVQVADMYADQGEALDGCAGPTTARPSMLDRPIMPER